MRRRGKEPFLFARCSVKRRSMAAGVRRLALVLLLVPVAHSATSAEQEPCYFGMCDFRLSDVVSADIQVSSVDDEMSVEVNDVRVVQAKFGEAPPRTSIRNHLKAGPNKIVVNIYNGPYGGCGGRLELRLNGQVQPDVSRTWSVPMKDAWANANCILEVLTLNLR